MMPKTKQRKVFMLPAHQLCVEWRIAGSFDLDRGRGVFEGTHVVRGQLDVRGSEILFQAGKPGGSWDGNNPRLLCEQPGECNLCRGRLLLFCERADYFDQSLVCFAIFRSKPGNSIAEVRAVELCVRIDRSRQEAFAE